jgi:hypothetical protein
MLNVQLKMWGSRMELIALIYCCAESSGCIFDEPRSASVIDAALTTQFSNVANIHNMLLPRYFERRYTGKHINFFGGKHVCGSLESVCDAVKWWGQRDRGRAEGKSQSVGSRWNAGDILGAVGFQVSLQT